MVGSPFVDVAVEGVNHESIIKRKRKRKYDKYFYLSTIHRPCIKDCKTIAKEANPQVTTLKNFLNGYKD